MLTNVPVEGILNDKIGTGASLNAFAYLEHVTADVMI